jgi:hypothetical protein
MEELRKAERNFMLLDFRPKFEARTSEPESRSTGHYYLLLPLLPLLLPPSQQ